MVVLIVIAIIAPFFFAYFQRRERHAVYQTTLEHKERELERLVKDRDRLYKRLVQLEAKIPSAGPRSKAPALKSGESSQDHSCRVPLDFFCALPHALTTRNIP